MTDKKTEQNKLNFTNYYSQLSEIEAQAKKEKDVLINAIQAEQAEIKSLLDEYQKIKQKKEIDAIKASLDQLSDFKQHLLSKIKSEAEALNTKQVPEELEPKNSQSDNSSSPPATAIVAGGADVKKLETKPNNREEAEQKETVAKLVEFIDQTTSQELIKLYPSDLASVIPNFNFNNFVVRDQLLQHYQQNDQNTYEALIKLYQKPDLKFQVHIPNIQKLADEDKKYHEFILINYPNALPFFWFLVNREPESIKYVVMELAMDHIIQTNTLDTDNNRYHLSLSLSELLSMNNGATLTNFLKDLFVCFHPQRVSKNNNGTNKYFDYIDNVIKQESTVENSRVLQLWNHMKQSGYNAVSSAHFSFASLNNSNKDYDTTVAARENAL